METFRDTIVLSSIGIYMLLCIAIGIWALSRTRSSSDFFMAGRNLGILVTAFAVFSSTMSGFGFVGGPGLVYNMGMSSVWITFSSVIGFNIGFYLLAKRLRIFAELGNFLSLPEVIGYRYQNQQTRLLVAIAIVLGVIGYMATQILAMSVVLRDLLQQTDFLPAISLEACMIFSGSILVFYSVTGGIIASVYTDLIQGAIMIVAALLIFITAITVFDGGIGEVSTIIYNDDPEAIGPWGTIGIMGCLSWFLVFGLGAAGQPHVITKMMMNKKVSDARYILPVSLVGYAFTALLWVSIGLVMRALVLSQSFPELSTPDAAAPQFLQHYAHPILAGIVFAGLFAAIMSTADAFLNIGTAAVMYDIPSALGREVKNQLLWARITTVGLTVVAGVFALFTGELVALLGAFGWGTFAAAIVPTVGLGFNWKKATPFAANVAIVSSLAINFGFKLLGIRLPYNIDIGAFALLISITLFVSISWWSRAPKLKEEITAAIDL